MGGSKKKSEKKYTDRYELPAYMQQGSRQAVGMASGIARRDYEAYGGDRIADLSENEQLGLNLARQNYGKYDQDYESARGALSGMSSWTDEGVAEQYMNPYMEQVLAPTRRYANEAFDAERAQRQANRGMTGAFGGRGQMWENKFESDFRRDQQELTEGAYGRAYESAAGIHAGEQDRALKTASQYGSIAESQASSQRMALMDLMNSGFVERSRDQAELDFKYIEHLEERDWDVTNLNTLVQTLASVPHEYTRSGESTTTETAKPSATKLLAGAAMITAGIMTGGAALAPMVAAGGQTAGSA